jgi:hypothetical protein
MYNLEYNDDVKIRFNLEKIGHSCKFELIVNGEMIDSYDDIEGEEARFMCSQIEKLWRKWSRLNAYVVEEIFEQGEQCCPMWHEEYPLSGYEYDS